MTVRPLADVVAALDDAFAAAPRPTAIDACPCCIRAEEIAVLLNTPRRRLQADDLAGYGVDVMNTVGGAEDLRYFTPRLLELALAPDGMTWPDMELLFIKLGRANWWSWPEATILQELMDALWTDVLTHHPSWAGTGEVLCSLGSAQASIAHRLHAWSHATPTGTPPARPTPNCPPGSTTARHSPPSKRPSPHTPPKRSRRS